MVQLILESPIAVGILGFCASAIAGVLWTQTGHKAAAGTAITLLVLTLGLIALSIQVQTEQENITHMLYDVADALQRNDRQYVLGHIHPQATGTVQRAKSELPKYDFRQARVTNIKSILIDDSRSPETAVAEFNVIVSLTFDGFSGQVPRFVKLYLSKKDGRWLVKDYEHSEPLAGLRR